MSNGKYIHVYRLLFPSNDFRKCKPKRAIELSFVGKLYAAFRFLIQIMLANVMFHLSYACD